MQRLGELLGVLPIGRHKLLCSSEQSILPAHVYAVAVCGAGFKGPS